MFCESSTLTGLFRPARRSAIALLAIASLGCGHKAPPIPPPLRNPAAASDLVVQQRGDELILSFSYPQTTVSGTPLEPLQSVECWEVVKPVPEWVPPTPEPSSEDDSDGETPAEESTTPSDIFVQSSGAGDDSSLPDDPETAATDAALPDEEAEGDDLEPEPSPVLQIAPTKEELLKLDRQEFAALAQLRETFSGDAIEALTFGDRIILTLSLGGTTESAARPAAPSDLETASEDETPELGSIFAVKTAVGPKLSSDFSNTVTIAHRTAPGSPSGFTLEPGPDRILLRWPTAAAEEALVGYHVYRRDAQSPRYGEPLAFIPLDEPAGAEDTAALPSDSGPNEREFSDRSALLGQRYIYGLTAVSNRNPVVESAITSEREVDYADRFPPSAPENLLALAESGRIRLLWDASPEDDVIGYLVQRRTRDGSFSTLTPEPTLDLEYSDRAARVGESYGYRVVAVDRAGNESEPSETVEVRAP